MNDVKEHKVAWQYLLALPIADKYHQNSVTPADQQNSQVEDSRPIPLNLDAIANNYIHIPAQDPSQQLYDGTTADRVYFSKPGLAGELFGQPHRPVVVAGTEDQYKEAQVPLQQYVSVGPYSLEVNLYNPYNGASALIRSDLNMASLEQAFALTGLIHHQPKLKSSYSSHREC